MHTQERTLRTYYVADVELMSIRNAGEATERTYLGIAIGCTVAFGIVVKTVSGLSQYRHGVFVALFFASCFATIYFAHRAWRASSAVSRIIREIRARPVPGNEPDIIVPPSRFLAWRTSRQNRRHPVVVLGAMYEPIDDSGGGADVTDLVSAHILAGRLDMLVSNELLGGDPTPAKPKKLVVRYQCGKKEMQTVIDEGNRVTLP